MKTRAFPFFYLLVLCVMSSLAFKNSTSSDLVATWMAGKYFFEGNFAQVYAHYDQTFTMRPPSDWLPYLRANGYNDAIYPFIYPPLWAWLASQFHRIASFEDFIFIATIVNPILLGSTVLLAAKTATKNISLPIYAIAMTAIFAVSLNALVALEQNQPQILVGFLIVLGIERARSGAPIAAGIAMALAASLKLYPVIFAVLWIATGNRRAAIAFACFGAFLGVTSIITSGWPLHQVFLSDVSAISRTVLSTFFTYSIGPVLASVFLEGQQEIFPLLTVAATDGEIGGWAVYAKPIWLRVLDAALILSVVSLLFLLGRSEKGNDPLFWPLAITAVAVVSPLSWGYHYLPALAFAFVLFERARTAYATIFMFLIFFPSSLLFITFGFPGLTWSETVQPLATAAMIFYAGILWFHLKKPADT